MIYLLASLALLLVVLMLYFFIQLLRSYSGWQLSRSEKIVPLALNESLEDHPESLQVDGKPPDMQLQVHYQHETEPLDVNFSITIGGDYLGECGASTAETLGITVPSKAAALEIWLYDKADFHVVCSELASEYAFRDFNINSRLRSKGQVLLARTGQMVELHTNRLLLRARLDRCQLAGERLRPESYFQEAEIHIAIWRRN